MQTWIGEHVDVVEGDAGAPIAFTLSYFTSSNEEIPVHAIKAGTAIWGDAVKMAEAFEDHATRQARGIMGPVQFMLGVLYKNSGRPMYTMRVLKAGATNIGGGVGLDPSQFGQTLQGQRILDAMAVVIPGERRDIINTQNTLIRMLMTHVQELNTDNNKTRLALIDVQDKMREREAATRMAELGHQRSTMLLSEGIKYAPVVLNQITGKKWIPAALEEKAFAERWLENHTEAEIEAEIELQQRRDPIFASFMVSHLAEIKKRKVDAEGLKKKMSGEAAGSQTPATNGQKAEREEAPKPDIDLSCPHSLSKEHARKGVEALAVAFAERFGGITCEWRGDLLLMQATSGMANGVSGSVLVGDAELRARMVLPFTMKLAKAAIEAQLATALADAATNGGQ